MTSMLFASMWLELRVPACHPERTLVILTTTRLSSFANAQDDKRGTEILRFAQDDTGEPIRLSLSDVAICWKSMLVYTAP